MSVQLENGYTKIANEILDALCRCHPGFTEGQILWAVIRKTYGWNKKTDRISISQLVKATGKSRRMVIYAIQNLEAKKMISVSRSFNQTNNISFNKNHTQWASGQKSPQYKKLHLVQEVAPSATNGKNLVQHSVKSVPKVAPTKETNTKETLQKKTNTKVLVAEAKPLTKKNPYVEIVLSEFQSSFSFRPTDKKPRFVAHNFSKNIQSFLKVFNPDVTEARFTKVIRTYLAWLLTQDYANKIETLDLVRRKFSIWADPQVTSYQKGRNATTGK